MKLRITIWKDHSRYLCQISLQIMLLPILMLPVCHYSHDYTILPYISSIFNRIISRKTGLFTETLLPVMSSLAMETRSKWQTLGWWDRYMKMCTAQGSPKNFLWSGWPQNHFIKAFTPPKVICEFTIPAPLRRELLKLFYWITSQNCSTRKN